MAIHKLSELTGWVFTFNEYTEKWYAAKRENYTKLFSDINSNDVIGSSSIKTLTELINKTGGDKKKIEALCTK